MLHHVPPLRRPARALGVAALLSALAATPSAAQLPSIQLGARGSTMGYGPEVTLPLGRVVGVRVAYHTLAFGRDFENADASYRIEPSFKGTSWFLDLHPFRGKFRLSGGLVSHTARVDLAATPVAGTITLDDVDYSTADAGTVKGSVRFPASARYVGMGWGPSLKGTRRFGVAFDVGVLNQAEPTTTLTATGRLMTDPGPAGQSFRTALENERASLQQQLGEQPLLRWLPVVSLALRFRLF